MKLLSSMISQSCDETKSLAASFMRKLSSYPDKNIIAFCGDLGSGKTEYIKGMMHIFSSQIQEKEITSPTFTYLHIYPVKPPIFHFDLYRLQNADAFVAMGFDEYFDKEGFCLIEWADSILPILPMENTFKIEITHLDTTKRKICLYG